MTKVVALPILNADDYAMTAGVSDAIEQLARARRLSATSVMTNMPGWPARASRLRDLRDTIATGLHLNLTVGPSSGAMGPLAPDGNFRPLRTVIFAALSRRFDKTAARAEIGRQLDLFETHLGFAPDHVDGHQHVHVLPIVRVALIEELTARYGNRLPLVRLPFDSESTLAAGLRTGAKPGIVAALGAGAANAFAAASIPTNKRFSGYSAFDTSRDYMSELDGELRRVETWGAAPSIVMCHPGIPDAELARLDPVTTRRRQEFDALLSMPDLSARIWHPVRTVPDAPLLWPK